MIFIYLCSILIISSVYSYNHNEISAKGDILVVGGNFSIDGKYANLASFHMVKGQWELLNSYALYKYGESYGEIWDIAVNRTNSKLHNNGYDRLYVVGSFDTESSASQIQFCSIGLWNGIHFNKIGEGLCPRGTTDSEMKVSTVILGNNDDLFVAGNFESRVWDGYHFVSVYNIALYEGASKTWLPLNGHLKCGSGQEIIIETLAWDGKNEILYIGGRFNTIDDYLISSGLAMWSRKTGLITFPTDGLTFDSNIPGTAKVISHEPISNSLFISGEFQKINNNECHNIAVYSIPRGKWSCLYQEDKSIQYVTTMLIFENRLFIAGWASEKSDWLGNQWQNPYSIAILNIEWFINENSDSNKKFIGSRSLYNNNINKKSSNNTNIVDRELRKHSTSKWSWLSGYTGSNGPVVRMKGMITRRSYHDVSIFIVGAFTNSPAVMIWNENNSSIQYISSKINNLYGLITSIVQVHIPHIDNKPNIEPSKNLMNFPVFILISCIIIGIFLGISFSVGFGNQDYYEKISNKYDNDLEEGNENGVLLNFISNKNGFDFRLCFEKAMKARHLETHESLLIIKSKEIILDKIIGEGSFGRVWSGRWTNNNVAVKEFVFTHKSGEFDGYQDDVCVNKNSIVEEIVGEAGIMACLRHPKILQIYGCSVTLQSIWIVSELCSKGSLRMLLDDKDLELTKETKISLAIDVADALLYLHSRDPPIIHRYLFMLYHIYII
jgi:hypothetical protein